MFKAPQLDWCSLMSGKISTSGFLKGFISAVKEISPVLFQTCPYKGHYEIVNLGMGRKFLALVLAGRYRAELYITDDSGRILLTLSITLEING